MTLDITMHSDRELSIMTVNDESMYLQLKKKIPECAKFSEIHAALWALCADYQIVYTAEQMESAIDTWENQ